MMRLIGKKIVETRMDDARFLKGQGVVEALFNNTFEFGKSFTLHFDDGSRLVIAPTKDPDGDKLVGCYHENGGS
jgi:hypothetical protein